MSRDVMKLASSDPIDVSEPPDNFVPTADIRAVSRAAQVLNLFTPAQPEISATAVAQQLAMNRTTAYRYCMSLATAQLLERLDNGHFAPGRILLQLGAFALGRRQVLDAAPRHMRAPVHHLWCYRSAQPVGRYWARSSPRSPKTRTRRHS